MMIEERTDRLTEKIIGAAIEVHRELGPGLLESVYEACLAHELQVSDMLVEQQKHLPIIYKGLQFQCGYRLDLIVENSVIVEVKSVAELCAVHKAQLLSYLKMNGGGTGLLINFNVAVLKDGLRRLIL